MQRPRRTDFASLALASSLLVLACRPEGTFRGPNFGPLGDPYRKEGLPEIPRRSDAPVFRVILIGDAGQVSAKDATLALVRRWGDELPDRTRVIYLGDNVYPAGLQAGDRARGEAVLRRQLRATKAKKLFIPGNHDWGFSGRQWLRPGVLGNQQAFIESQAKLGADFLPKDGCPGPSEVELLPPGEKLGGGLTVLALDLHWWLLADDQRPQCKGIDDTTTFLERFGEALKAHEHRNLLVVAHHPIRSGGPHGGQSRGFWMDLGVFLAQPFYRTQDVFEPGYQEMVRLLEKEMSAVPPLAMIGGHDHSLQVIEGGGAARIVIVSGAGSRTSGVSPVDGTLFAHAHLGFVVLDFFRLEGGTEETLLVRVVETGRGDDPVFTAALDLTRKEEPAVPVVDPEKARSPARARP